jgi:hypothetical protein
MVGRSPSNENPIVEIHLIDSELTADEISGAIQRVCNAPNLQPDDPLKDLAAKAVTQIARAGERDLEKLYVRALDTVLID